MSMSSMMHLQNVKVSSGEATPAWAASVPATGERPGPCAIPLPIGCKGSTPARPVNPRLVSMARTRYTAAHVKPSVKCHDFAPRLKARLQGGAMYILMVRLKVNHDH